MESLEADWVDVTVGTSVAREGPPNPPLSSSITFHLNGMLFTEHDPSPTLLLLDYLRATVGLTGTKGSCRQGGCGACTVMMDGLSINACLRPLVACDGRAITTTEGVGNGRDGYSKVQAAIAEGNGSQCGFCTPGWVMNMHSLLAQNPKATPADVERQFDGNICRCTGYRPILASFHKLVASGGVRACPSTPAPLPTPGPKAFGDLAEGGGAPAWVEPTSVPDLLNWVRSCKAGDCKYRIVAGNTGHGVYADPGVKMFISSAKVKELHASGKRANGAVSAGAGVSINALVALLQDAPGKPEDTHGVLAAHMLKIANNQVGHSRNLFVVLLRASLFP
jgi:xanthine dehydrogenase/oxidase